jgi:predicted ester cyclase
LQFRKDNPYLILGVSDVSELILEENRRVFHRLIEVGFNKGDLSVADELVASDFREHQRGASDGPDGVKDLIRGLREMTPDVALTIEDMVEDGDKVWPRMTARGTDAGQIMGRPPTGRRYTIDVIDICRFKAGKIVEHWGLPDQLGMLQQLGLVPD